MTCREVLDFVMKYLDGELDAPTRQAFERHLTVCRSCVNYLDSYKATVRAGKDAMKDASRDRGDEIPRGLIDAVRDALMRRSRDTGGSGGHPNT